MFMGFVQTIIPREQSTKKALLRPIVAFCRLIRHCQIGLSHHGDNYLISSAFELFGSLIEAQD
jgi:hypothetical protein